jgi:hypothetical protein
MAMARNDRYHLKTVTIGGVGKTFLTKDNAILGKQVEVFARVDPTTGEVTFFVDPEKL